MKNMVQNIGCLNFVDSCWWFVVKLNVQRKIVNDNLFLKEAPKHIKNQIRQLVIQEKLMMAYLMPHRYIYSTEIFTYMITSSPHSAYIIDLVTQMGGRLVLNICSSQSLSLNHAFIFILTLPLSLNHAEVFLFFCMSFFSNEEGNLPLLSGSIAISAPVILSFSNSSAKLGSTGPYSTFASTRSQIIGLVHQHKLLMCFFNKR